MRSTPWPGPARHGAWRHCAPLLAALLPGLAGAGPTPETPLASSPRGASQSARASPPPAAKPLPQRDLLIELREADAGQTQSAAGTGGWSVRSTDASVARERPAQQVRVHNGASASMALSVTRPLQVWQVVPGAYLPVPVPQTQWIAAGQGLTVQPRWPGGREPVSVALSADSSRLDPHVAPGSAELPQRSEARLATTVSAPLDQWVTIASGGADEDDSGVVASGQAAKPRRLLQLRVRLVP